jgi:hypothetical protein
MNDWMVAWEDAYGMFLRTEFFDTEAEAIAEGQKPKPLSKRCAVVIYRLTQQQVIQEAP